MDRADLRDEIARAFRGTRRDPEQSLHQAQLSDQGMSRAISDGEWHTAGRLDRETEWTEVEGAAVDECDAALSHFTPASWRFYLPAYLCRALELFAAPTFAAELLDAVVFQLTLPAKASQADYLRERFDSLSPDQHLAVRHFLESVEREALHLVETTNGSWRLYADAQNALASYWRR